MRKMHKDETGLAIVEAAMLIPFCLIMVLALYYAAIFMYQKAYMQANLQNALIYYKNPESDTYVEPYKEENGTILVNGNYGEPEYRFPYRFMFDVFDGFDHDGFASFYRTICGFEDDSVSIETKEKNYVIYKEITAEASWTVKPAVSLEMVGIPNEITLKASAKVVVSDAEEMIRNVDFVIDIVQNTALGKKAGELVDAAKDFYEDFKKKFGVK